MSGDYDYAREVAERAARHAQEAVGTWGTKPVGQRLRKNDVAGKPGDPDAPVSIADAVLELHRYQSDIDAHRAMVLEAFDLVRPLNDDAEAKWHAQDRFSGAVFINNTSLLWKDQLIYEHVTVATRAYESLVQAAALRTPQVIRGIDEGAEIHAMVFTEDRTALQSIIDVLKKDIRFKDIWDVLSKDIGRKRRDEAAA